MTHRPPVDLKREREYRLAKRQIEEEAVTLDRAMNTALVTFISLGAIEGAPNALNHSQLVQVGGAVVKALRETPDSVSEETLLSLERGLDIMSSIMEGVMKQLSN